MSEPDQPQPGGMCDTCGHFALRHNRNGCTGVIRACTCRVFMWAGIAWPEPSRADGYSAQQEST